MIRWENFDLTESNIELIIDSNRQWISVFQLFIILLKLSAGPSQHNIDMITFYSFAIVSSQPMFWFQMAYFRFYRSSSTMFFLLGFSNVHLIASYFNFCFANHTNSSIFCVNINWLYSFAGYSLILAQCFFYCFTVMFVLINTCDSCDKSGFLT